MPASTLPRLLRENMVCTPTLMSAPKVVTVTLTEREGGKREWLPHVEENMH